MCTDQIDGQEVVAQTQFPPKTPISSHVVMVMTSNEGFLLRKEGYLKLALHEVGHVHGLADVVGGPPRRSVMLGPAYSNLANPTPDESREEHANQYSVL